MLRGIFCLLLAVNGALFALGQGYLGELGSGEREPGRLQNQLAAGQLKPISAAAAEAAVAAAAPSARAAPAADEAPETFACTEVGNFTAAEARRFEAELDALALGDRQSRHNVPGQEISSYIVYLPPQGSKEGADKKAAELKQLGVTNFFIMGDGSPLRWGISLGVFKSEAGAQAQLAALHKQGVRSARVAPRMAGSKQMAYQFRDLDAPTKARLERIAADFPAQQERSCR